MRVAVVGAGIIGERRARVASQHPGTEVVIVVDVDADRASRIADDLDSGYSADWREAVGRGDVDIVVVATPNNLLAPVSTSSLKAGKHVLCEKPMAMTAEDAERMLAAAAGSAAVLKVGYNLRHHPAIARARKLLAQGVVGDPMFVRCCYGHGGRPGYEKEWRCDPAVSGGGELMDQGVHVIDLSGWFLGEFVEAFGIMTTAFWSGASVSVEDNVFALLKTAEGRVASFHVSWTQWKNRFLFEVFGTKGYLIAEGLGGSYGPERLVLGIRDERNPLPREETFEFEDGDVSWREEWKEFMRAVSSGTEPEGGGHDGLRVLRVVEAVYRSARSGKIVPVHGSPVFE